MNTPPRTEAVQQKLAQAHRLADSGRKQEAAALCREVLSLAPEQPDAHHLLGLMANEAGDGDAALLHLRRACAAPDAHPAFLSNFAEICRRAGLLPEGEDAARRAVARDPARSAAWNNLGIILQEQGRYAESLACLQRVLALTPDSPEAQNNFANTCKRLGRIAEAEAHWLAALELRDDYPQPHSNLASLYTELGTYPRAAYHARRAITLAPQFADAHLNLAMLEKARGRLDAALAALDTLLRFAPGHATALAAKALALVELDRLEPAMEVAQRATALAPGNGEAWHALGQVAQSCGDTRLAADAYQRASALPGPAAEKAAGSRAMLLMESGESEAAAAAFEAAIAAYPRSAMLYYNRADLKRPQSSEDAHILAMRRLLEDDALDSANDRLLLHFALGNAYLHLGESALAFHHLNQGNRMKRATIAYDAAATSRWIASIAESSPSETLQTLRAAVAASARTEVWPGTPVFVLGMPRSGTTLVEQILASHPEVFGAGELPVMQRLVMSIADFPAETGRMSAATAATLGATYRRNVAQRFAGRIGDTTRYVVDKMPANFLYLGLIAASLPEARIIHCRRDAVDTCLSCYSKLFTHEQSYSYNLEELGLFHRDYQQLMAHWRTVLPATHFLEVDYEAVVDDLEGEARRMLDFLGLAWSPACVGFHRTARPVRTASMNQVRQPIFSTSVGRWRRHAAHLQPLLKALQVT